MSSLVHHAVVPLALFIPSLLCAQVVNRAAAAPEPIQPAAASATAPSLLALANTSRLRPGKLTYAARLMGTGLPHRLGFRTLELTKSNYEGSPAWLLVDARQMATVTLAESLYVTIADLTPLHRVSHSVGSDVRAEYGSDSIRVMFDGSDGEARVAMANGPGLLANLYFVELLIGAAPLDSNWSASARLAAVGRDGKGLVPIEAHTTGQEQIPVPDGSFDCWVVQVTMGKSQQMFWVRKSDGVVIKQRIPVIGMQGELELLLAEHGVERKE
jgi:hypothetical protein